MVQSDIKNIETAYLSILKEDIGAAADPGQGAIVMGIDMSDSSNNRGSYQDKAKDMAKSQLLNTMKEIKSILNELNSKKLEPWMADKISTVSDRISSVDEWLQAQ